MRDAHMQFLTIKELSKLIKVKEKTIYYWASVGLIPCFKLNGVLRFDQEEIEQWIKNSKIMPKGKKKFKPKVIKNTEINNIVKKVIESVQGERYNALNGEARPVRLQKGGISGNL